MAKKEKEEEARQIKEEKPQQPAPVQKPDIEEKPKPEQPKQQAQRPPEIEEKSKPAPQMQQQAKQQPVQQQPQEIKEDKRLELFEKRLGMSPQVDIKQKLEPAHTQVAAQEQKVETTIQTEQIEKKNEQPKPPQIPQTVEVPQAKAEQQHAKPASAPKVTFTTRLKGIILREVKISEKDADPFIESLKMDLLQSDVNYDVTDKITASIRNGLVGKPISSRNMEGEITQAIRESIMQVLVSRPNLDIVTMVKNKKESGVLPFKIMFIGPNGAGKTTTMAKIASMLIGNGITCVMSASDTFRAAAIEQTVHHADKLGIGVVKGNYGSDPASVAFDAIAHAKARGIMAVLIDSAGRQETNKSLIEELKKMVRVTSPDLKIFVGEAISGNALLEQVKAIDQAVKIDGIILTKLDVDAKGGNTLSILSDTTVPILYFGTGEKYTDIMAYDPKFIIDNILPA
ncbi:MAG: signal recognition particle-docking protein FtsY [Candidatus Micrarchaeota archaeon]|nr:signal recognition particle-docking protein FtsY [Candidatus Micrarchaeota archaeon]